MLQQKKFHAPIYAFENWFESNRQILPPIQDIAEIIECYGDILSGSSDPQSAARFYTESSSLYQSKGSFKFASLNYKLALSHFAQKDHKLSLGAFKKALELCDRVEPESGAETE